VVGYGTDEFPAFFTPHSGHKTSWCASTASASKPKRLQFITHLLLILSSLPIAAWTPPSSALGSFVRCPLHDTPFSMLSSLLSH
jgi:pseudouridine-5'-phosphate glycosidase